MPTPARVAILLAFALPVSALAAAAEDVSDRGEAILQSAWTSEEECSERNAVDASFAEIEKETSTLNGSCVRVSGYWRGRGLYADEEALGRLLGDAYLPPSFRDLPVWPQGRIGLYARPEVLARGPERGRRAQAYGIVRSCQFFDGYLMVLGYCHYVGGPILIVSKIEFSD